MLKSRAKPHRPARQRKPRFLRGAGDHYLLHHAYPAGLNKGEGRNATARALFFNQLGELPDRRFENQSYRTSALNLLVAAIILWNARYLDQALADMGTPGDVARHIAPLGWEHIALTGDYCRERDDRPTPDQLRPLRTSSSLPAA